MAIYKAVNSKGTQTHGALMNTLKYILNPDKTDPDLCYVTSNYEYDEITPKNIYLSYLETKKTWENENGRQYMHSILSWSGQEHISPETALQFAIRFAEHTYPGHQTAVVVHTDKDHLHCHLVVNTVNSMNGKKLHKSKKDLKKDKEFCNELCKQYGLTIAEKGKHFDGSPMEPGEIVSWKQAAYRLLTNLSKPSFIADCGLAVINALKQASSKDQFIESMKSYGWRTKWEDSRKNITFQNSDGKKVRDKTLLKTFGIKAGKEDLEYEFTRTRENKRTEGRSEQRDPGSKSPDPEAARSYPGSDRGSQQTENRNSKTKGYHRTM